MDIALNQPLSWSRRNLAQINACRRYLQAQTLADITNLAGTQLLPHASALEEPPTEHVTRIARFNQEKPGRAAWRTWRRFLRTVSDKRGYLINPLGLWLVSHNQTRHWPTHVYDPNQDQLYTHVQGSHYRPHHRFTRGTFTNTYHDQINQVRGYPTSLSKIGGILRPQKNYVQAQDLSPQLSQPTLPFLKDTLPWEKELLQKSTLLIPLSDLASNLHTGNVITCSDGAATSSHGSFGFIVSTAQGQRLATCSGPVPGSFSNSFRSEAYGVLATVRFLQLIVPAPTYRIKITHYLDNQSVIARIESTNKHIHHAPNQRLKSEQDVIDAIYNITHGSMFELQLKWVRGHQDDTTQFNSLPLPAQLNCEADRQASQYEFTPQHSLSPVTPLPGTPCQLIIHGKSITGKLKRRVHDAATLPQLMNYLRDKFEWSAETLDTIDWQTYSHIIQKYKEKWTTIVKHVHAISPTGHIAHRNNSNLPHACPVCSAPHENNAHIIQCPHISRAQWRSKTIQRVQAHQTAVSDPYLIDILHDGLLRYHRQSDPTPPDLYQERYHALITTQNAIGWDQLYRGRWSIEWSQAHNKFTQTQPTRACLPSGPEWVLSFGRLLMDQWLELWALRNEQRHGKDVATKLQNRLAT
jgi:hypothetical protein